MSGAVHATPQAIAAAAGALAAQRVCDEIAAGEHDPRLAWLRLVELAARFGWRSAATAAYTAELAKRAAAGSDRG